MKVLIVEDDADKAGVVTDFILGLPYVDREGILVAENLSDAIRAINQARFDVIVLDLMLPYLVDGPATSGAGLELLRQIRRRGQNESSAVIGLSAFPDETDFARSEFSNYGVAIAIYDERELWKQTIQRVVFEQRVRSRHREEVDFLIFAALEEERAAVLACDLDIIENRRDSGLNITYVRLRTNPPMKGAVIKFRDVGLVAAALDVTLALATFKSPLVCMCGICAGFPANAGLGQLIIASPAWEYQAGKWSRNGFEIAPRQIQLRPMTRLAIEQGLGATSVLADLESGLEAEHSRPTRRLPPILAPAASGSAVIADHTRLTHIAQQHRKVAAVDMETFGLYYACHESTDFVPDFFSIKCVVDLGDAGKDDDLHPYGCSVAARGAIYLLSTIAHAR